MNIVIVYGGSFPYGQASANHILSYSRELVKRGHEVHVLCTQPFIDKKKMSSYNFVPEINGVYDGVNYHYVAGTVFWPYGKLSMIKKLLIRLKILFFLDKFLKNNRINIFLTMGPGIISSFVLSFIAHKHHLLFTVERTELPEIYKNQDYYKSNFFLKVYKFLSEKSFQKPDVWIVETRTLQEYYQQFSRKDARFFVVPMTVEIDRFINIKKDESVFGDYVAYCGNMREDDGVSILIKSFALVADKYPNVKLVFAGESEDTYKQKRLVSDLGLDDRVVFLGRISRDEIPTFLNNAKVLALASPTSLRSCATMPCKIGEYLCTGKPVVVTGLGEVNCYLKDGETAYISDPDNVESFAKKLDEALSNDDKSKIIGTAGKNVALLNFSSERQTQLMIDIFTELSE